MRVTGRGIDGGVIGAPGMVGSLYRGGTFVVGAHGCLMCEDDHTHVSAAAPFEDASSFVPLKKRLDSTARR